MRNIQLPPEQQAIREKCFHPSGKFIEFPLEDVETSVCARFEKMVAQYPDNWAIATDEESLTYAELNERANRVAYSIIDQRGIGSEPIGLLFDTKLTLIVAMLGVLKAGKFFVLLDSGWPEARLRVILNDVQAELLLIEGPMATMAMNLDINQVLDIGRLGNDARSGDLQLPISPETLLCISYTTGSTGRPKGVILSQRNLLHQVMLFTNVFHHCDRDRISYLTSGTNSAVFHPFFALLIGAGVLPFDLKRHGLEALAVWLRQDKISICSLSAPLFRNLVKNLPSRKDFPDLRLLRLSSEAAYKTDFDLYRKYFPAHCLLANGVAPAETCLLSVYLMDHGSRIDTDEIPIGYPVQDKEILIIDDSGNEIGPNQIGEIVVRSAYLSPGYWKLPDLTAAKFTAPVYEAAARSYCSGDLGLRRPNGCLIHKGRKDFRVKVRGYGVEPAEVEAMMRQHPAVREACVVGRLDKVSGASQLIGYFTQAQGGCLVGSELRTFLDSRLPDYMIPAAFVPLPELPLTANGKVNRAALPAPAAIRPELNVPYAAPTNEREAQLSRIWREVLGLEAIGIHDNFFDLGGDSLAAMRIIARIRNWLHAEIPFIEFYEAPTISALAALVERSPQVKPEQQAAPIHPRERAHPIPLSLGQERLWFLEQLEPHAHRYNLIAGFRLQGSLDAVALERAINEIVKRHESLRTVFESADGKPFQVVLDAASINVPVVDIAPKPGETVEQAMFRMCAEEGQRPFDLTCGPLLRATIVRADAQLIALILAIHHFVFDGWSMDVFARELSASYAAALNRQPFQLAPLPIQYADFVMWQRAWLQSRDLDAHLLYWRSRLAEISDLQLPTDRSRPQFRDGRATRHWFTIAPSVTRALKDISGEAGVTLFMTLLAAYQTLLCRYSGQDDICVGVPVAGRQDEALDDAIGLFLNMLVLRTDLSGDPRFRELLGRVRQRCVEAYDHQDVPFERLVEELQPNRLVDQHPLFQASFALRPGGACAIHLRDLEVQELEIDPGISRFDFELYLEEKYQGLHGYMAGSADIFDASTIERLVGHLRTLLESIVTAPERRISALSILTGAERDQLLVKWNDTQADYPKDTCIHELFEKQVERKPDAVAVIFEDRELSYRELNRRSNRLARYLQKVGVGPDVLVGICMERSVESVIGLLGILKAGGAYVPLDTSYPAARLKFMLDDAQVSVLLTQEDLLKDDGSRIKGGDPGSALDPRIPQVRLDRDWELIAREKDTNPDNTASAENLAYVIYTSGSTGEPKGVAVPHRAVNRLVLNTDYVQLTPSEVMAQVSNVSFDAATFEIWGALLNGARLVLIAKDTLLSPQSLSTAIDRHGITTLFLTTALFNQMVEQIPAALGKLRYLLFGGETVDSERVKELLGNGPPSHLLHVYGPTETTTFATWHWVKAVAADATTVPIGRPIANTEIYILDADLNPVPIGIPGELYIGGSGVTRGYLNRPVLTAENFIKHPFTNDPQARLYKTGDRARYLPDGNIEYLGRLDNQVKIRGYRIEPGEIETMLAQHTCVREAVVVAHEDHVGEKQLVAYVVPNESAPPVSDLRAFLKEKLPDHMVPNAFVVLDSLPLTPNGKVDRKALPPPERNSAGREQLYVAPRNAVEEIIAGIWADVLGRKRIGAHDNFFDLGGHSLKATQVVSRLRTRLGKEIPLRDMFEYPTIAELALALGAMEVPAHKNRADTKPTSSSMLIDTYPLSPMQQGMLFHSLYAPDSGVYIKQIVCTLNEEVDVTLLHEIWQQTAARHGILRTTLRCQDLERPVQEEYASVDVPWLELNWQDSSDTNQQGRLSEFLDRDRRRGFVPSRAPLMRLTLIRKGAADFLVIWTYHHALLDGWSAVSITREVFNLYDAGRTGQKPTLPLLQPFRNYIDWFENQDLECAKNYWRELLAGFDGPTDMARKSTGLASPSEGNYQQAQTSLSHAATAQLRSFAAQHGVTPGTIVQAAWAMLVGRYTGRDDVVFGVTRAGRHWIVDGAQHMIGLFISTLPVRVRLPADREVAVWLKDLRNQAVEARPFEHTPLVKVQEWNQISAKQSLFDHIFVFDNQLFNSAVARGSQNSEHRHFLSLGTTHYPLAVNGFLEPELVLRIDYNCSSFDTATIARMLGHFRSLIENLIQDPHQRLADVAMLTEREKHQLLVEWHNPQTVYPRDKCIHQLFEEQVERTPDAIALVLDNQQLTYRELNSRANQLAHYLRKLGVGSEVLVGLCLERSIDMIVGLLGILKAGGAYVPLDPEYPQERLDFMLDDAQPTVLVGQERRLGSTAHRKIVFLDRDWPKIAAEHNANPNGDVTADNLAYVIYTSGSTGKPKGTLVTHYNVVRLFQATEAWFGFNSTDTWTLFHSYAFDFSVWEIWGALLHGGKLVIVPRETTRSPQECAALLIKHKVTVLNQTPSAFRQLLPVLTAQDSRAPSALRYVIFGGEALDPAALIPWFERYAKNGPELINMYGITETTVHVTYQPITGADAILAARSVIGKPIQDLQIHLFDANHCLVPIGIIGEIYVGGAGVARGYLNRPELTAERFIYHSFDGELAKRLYRTGDLARYLPDGNIEFVGRADKQVKIRGYRIELGEVEAALGQHPAIQQAVVLAREDTPGDKRLAAYVVAAPDATISAHELRSYLQQKLPEYLVPSSFIVLESLPLTPNGKVDHEALPEPDNSLAEAQAYTAPRNAVEEIIAGIWSEILGAKQIGVHDNFFDLGGHSLKATQVVSRLHKAFRSEIPLRHLFEFPTIAELAAVIDSLKKNPANENKLDRVHGFVGGRGAKTSG